MPHVRHRPFTAAYVQILGYKDDLGNPPLLVTSDLERIEIRTNFTGQTGGPGLVVLRHSW